MSSVLIPLQVCAAKNGTQSVYDQLYIKNLGGYGSASGASSGQDSVTLTLAVDHTLLQVSNVVFAAPFANPVVGTDPQGHPTYRVLIPAGLAVGDSLAVSINYTITPKVDNVCLKDQQPALCFFGLFSSPVLLSCPAKNINCGAVTRHLRGSGVSIRDLVCCYGSIGDYVWVDTNNDGQQGSTAAEPPIVGAKVYLLNASGAKIDSTVTDAQGKYLFDSLLAGSYRVQFTAPAGSKSTTANTGADVSDSDAGKNGITHLITIDVSKAESDTLRNNPQIDAGFVPFGSLGDYVWFDNGDNVQGSGDTPASGVKVYLLNAAGTKIDSTVTNAQGKYLFDSLVAGTYSVQFVVPAG
ncbi:SdrD B-like domain-containing protein [Runella sp. MFBS21]|uniref:SdrD B-like domain-containing protein n=1 Tax=Runella sp. MFBS21 TaxID=3034018 RepID=UPI0023F92507|nr:SdrD B-like domain-containing protein [Runella sp. MFBS21]MDF7820529.1 SdrD B-like domain-containing protein [Runella sp. MFBS21]